MNNGKTSKMFRKEEDSKLELAPPAETSSKKDENSTIARREAKKLAYAPRFEEEEEKMEIVADDDVGEILREGRVEKSRLEYAPIMEEQTEEPLPESQLVPGAYAISGINATSVDNGTTNEGGREENDQDFSNLPVGELVNEEYPEGEVVNLQHIVENSEKAVKKRLFFIFGIILTVVAIAVGIIFTRSWKQPTMQMPPTVQPSISLLPSALPSSMPTTVESNIFSLIESEIPSSQNDARREGTAQYIALNWIVINYNSIISLFDDDILNLLQIYSLVVVYHSTNGTYWRRNDNWLEISPGDVSSWYGVTWDNTNGVIELNLPNNRLVGNIPDEVVFLGNLNSIDLTDNRLDGISKEMASLSSLDSLWLHNNELTGRIPEEVAELMVTLQSEYYDLILEKVPMSRTTIYEYGTAQYRSFQTTVYRFKNGLFPDDLWQWYVLTLLYYSTNGDEWDDNKGGWLSSGDTCDWEEINCNSNKEVVRLSFPGNNLQGSLPAELGTLTMLTYLRLDENDLTGKIPTEIGNMVALEGLDLSDNSLTETIPTEIGKLTMITLLALSGNSLTGSIPTDIGRLTALKALYLQYNQLTCTIPNQIENLTNLERLSVHRNGLSGTLPEVLCDNKWQYTPMIDCNEIECSCCRGHYGGNCPT